MSAGQTFVMRSHAVVARAGLETVTELRRGCLMLADISGYTRYLSGVELEHSQDILADLLGVVAGELEAVGDIAKLEGDAVFACDSQGAADAETLLTAFDAAYFAFARRRRTIELRSSCTCQACARIPSLDLKLIAHHGEFIEHVVAGRPEVVGQDVILVHRLLKNQVSDTTGVEAFALITDACCRALSLDPATLGLQPNNEHYDDVGEVKGWVRDLGARWLDASASETVQVAPEEANFSFSQVCHAPAGVVWDALVAPEKKLQWTVGISDIQMKNPAGTVASGRRRTAFTESRRSTRKSSTGTPSATSVTARPGHTDRSCTRSSSPRTAPTPRSQSA